MRHIFDDEPDPDRIQQCAQPATEKQEGGDEEAREEEEKASDVGSHRPAAPRRQRELDRRRGDCVRQRDEGVGREIGRRPQRANRVRMYARQVHTEQDARLHAEQDQRVENEDGEKSPREVLGLADGGSVGEGIHPCRHVPRARFAGDSPGHQEPHQAAEHRGLRDGERRVDEEVDVEHLGEGTISRHQEIEYEQDDDDQPGPETAHLVGELKAKDPEELHACWPESSRRRDMALK